MIKLKQIESKKRFKYRYLNGNDIKLGSSTQNTKLERKITTKLRNNF